MTNMAADVRLHSAIERAISETPRRHSNGRFACKPKPRDIIAAALRAEYSPRSAAVLLDAHPLPVQQHFEPEETAADFFFPAMFWVHLILGAACVAMAIFQAPTVLASITYACLGLVCFWYAGRCVL